jgi:predicted ATPase/DNA-binding CsgD family transcriptional regulator
MGSRSPRPSNLPADLTSFVGRREELREVKRLLTTTRLLTLTGSGGAGKTRLALRAAADMARGFPGGARLVSLAAVQDPLLVPQAVFAALGVQVLSAGVSLSSLTEYLAGQRLLLVLDNCEHLLDACAILTSTVLTSCPDLHVLATSRQALSVAGEVRMVVPPMALPGAGAIVEDILACDAVGLLSERAAAVVPGFTVDAGNATAAAELCRRLDGIPLALELAAVRLGALSLDQLNQGLAMELSVLGRGNRGAEARQQTLEATIGWSYGMLDEPERLLWARLSVFAGGFDADAVAQVCSDPRLPADQIPGLLGSLVDKSIVKRQLTGSSARYWLLDTIRQYGRMRLRKYGEETLRQKRHLEWIRTLAKLIGAWDARQAELFDRMEQEQDNLWAALEFCLRQPGEVAAATDLAQDLHAYWGARGPYSDVRRVLDSLTELAPESSATRARLLAMSATVATAQNDFRACAALSQDALRIAAEVKDSEATIISLTAGTWARLVAGDVSGAAGQVESVLSLARLMRLEQAELNALFAQCAILTWSGDLDHAIDVGEQGRAISEARGELWVRGFLLNSLAQANWARGDRDRGEALAREAAVCKHALDDRWGLTLALETLAWMAAERGDHQRAACVLGSAERVRDDVALTVGELFRAQHEQSVSATVRGIGQKAFDTAFAQGRAMTISDGMAFATNRTPPRQRPPKAQARTGLTRRELEIARLIADDLSNREIAARLFLSERTVETHVTNIFNKLGLNSRVQITRWLAGLSEPTLDAAEERH